MLIGHDITMVKDQIQEAKYKIPPINGISIMHKEISISAHNGKPKTETGIKYSPNKITFQMTYPATPNEPISISFNLSINIIPFFLIP